VAVSAAAAVGENVPIIEQKTPVARLPVLQPCVVAGTSVRSPVTPEPVNGCELVILAAAVPVLVTLNSCVLLLLPTLTMPKL